MSKRSPIESEVIVPEPGDPRISKRAWVAYDHARAVTAIAVDRYGMEVGVSMVLSGVGRQIRAELKKAGMPPDAVLAITQSLFAELARTMPDVIKFDDPKNE